MTVLRIRVIVALMLSVAGTTIARAEDRDERGLVDDGRERATAAGTLAWIFAEELDLMGDVRVDLPFPVAPEWTVFAHLDALTAIEKTTSDFTFLVRDVNYRAEVGARRGRLTEEGWSTFVGQAGRYDVDDNGNPNVRYVGAGWHSSNIARSEDLAGGLPRWTGSGSFGWVFDDRGYEADVMLRAELQYRAPWRGVEVGFDVAIDGYGRFSGATFDADLRGGARIGWSRARPDGGAMRYDFFVHGLRGKSPFGLRIDGVLAGIDLQSVGGRAPAGSTRFADASAGGVVAAGASDAGGAGRLMLWVESPSFLGGWRGVILVDGNAFEAEDTNELYWFYHAGLERPWRELVVGAWFYHRSNHTWSAPNPVGVTSINVLEAGFDTPGWDRPDRTTAVRGWGALDGRVRVGYLLDSSFGKDQPWHARLGARWTAPWSFGLVRPFVELQHEDGDVTRSLAAIGARHAGGIAGYFEWREDEQYFGIDDEVLLAMVEVRF